MQSLALLPSSVFISIAMFSNRFVSELGIGIPGEKAITRSERKVYITLTTWKMTGPEITSDVRAKITNKITGVSLLQLLRRDA